MSKKISLNKKIELAKKMQTPKKTEELRVTADEIESAMKPSENDTTSHINVDHLMIEMNKIIKLSKGENVQALKNAAMLPDGVNLKELNEKDSNTYITNRRIYENKIEELAIKNGMKSFAALYPGIFKKLIYPMTSENKERMALFLNSVKKIKKGEVDIDEMESKLGESLFQRYIEPTLDPKDKERVKQNLSNMRAKMTPAQKRKQKRINEKKIKENAKKIAESMLSSKDFIKEESKNKSDTNESETESTKSTKKLTADSDSEEKKKKKINKKKQIKPKKSESGSESN